MATRELGFTALMTAVYKRLTVHALTNTYTFYNHVPKTATMPYHVIRMPMGIESPDYTTKDTEGEQNVFHIDSWLDETSGRGDKPCADMQNDIIQVITSSALVMVTAGYNDSIEIHLDLAEIIDDDTEPELEIKHGIMRFRVDMTPV